MKTIRIPLVQESHLGSFKHEDGYSISLCENHVKNLFDIGKSKEIDLILSSRKTKDSYKVIYDEDMVYFQDIEHPPITTTLGTDSYMNTHYPQVKNKTLYVSIEIYS